MILVFGALAWANSLSDFLPAEPLTTEKAAELLVVERVGPPARSYDQLTISPGAASEAERQIEAGLQLGEYAPSDAHRRYTRLYLELCRAGAPRAEQAWFLAEHVGLVSIPEAFIQFVVPKGNAAAAIEQVKDAVAQMRGEEDVRAISITVAEQDQQWVGVGTALVSTARFEAFPRVIEPGKATVIPGTLLEDKEKYSLYVTFPGPEVRTFPLEGSGEFDIEVPTPSEPGRYRVAMERSRKGDLPDSPFFFTLYVGTEPPVAFQPNDWGITATPAARADEVEKQFADAISSARQSFERGALAPVDGSAPLREILEGMPEGNERKRRRYLASVLSKDPLPGVPHGNWSVVYGAGYSGQEAAWVVVEHPTTRILALDGDFDSIGTGAVIEDNHFQVLSVLTVAAIPTADSRQRVWDTMSERWTGPKPASAPRLEQELDALAAQIASGKLSFNSGLKKVKGVAKKLKLQGYAAWAFVVPAGELPDLSGVEVPSDHAFLAIGDAAGTEKSGVGTTVLLVVSTRKAS